jgi:prepilin-type N-terminal cleavage/methylation domain-containing protein
MNIVRKMSTLPYQSKRFAPSTFAYTLIEVLVSLTIVGILFGFGYASYRNFSRRQALAGVVKQIQGDIRLTQQMALSGQKPTDLSCGTLDGMRFEITPPVTYGLRAQCDGAAGYSFKEVILPGDITITAGSTNPIIFKVLGQGTNLPAEGVTITLNQTGTSTPAYVYVTQVGEIK